VPDEWSDVDLILFYDGAWPGAAALDAGRATLAATEVRVLGGDVGGDSYLEQLRVDGVACQVVHQTVAAWRATAATVLEELDTTSPVQKALDGLHRGVVIADGIGLLPRLRAAAPYPEALRAAMVAANLGVFPLWAMQDALAARDAELWQRTELAAGLTRVLAMLAGVNRVWFSPFQLKHTADLVASLSSAPSALARRIDDALRSPMPDAALELERLVDETLTIVERELPGVDVFALRRSVGRRLSPWTSPSA